MGKCPRLERQVEMSVLVGKATWLVGLAVLCAGLAVGLVFGIMINEAEAAKQKTLSAVVDDDGTLVRGSKGVTGAQKTPAGIYHRANGEYFVYFGQDVTGCAKTATIGTDEDLVTPASGEIVVTKGKEGAIAFPNTVSVFTQDPTGAASDRPFYLNVNCAP